MGACSSSDPSPLQLRGQYGPRRQLSPMGSYRSVCPCPRPHSPRLSLSQKAASSRNELPAAALQPSWFLLLLGHFQTLQRICKRPLIQIPAGMTLLLRTPGNQKAPPDPQGMGGLQGEKGGNFHTPRIPLRFCLYVYLFWGQHTCASLEVRGQLAGVGLLCYLNSRDPTQVVKLGGKYLYPPSHLKSPFSVLFYFDTGLA